jgi:hypothetical protein
LVVRALPGSAEADNDQLRIALDAALDTASTAATRVRHRSSSAAAAAPAELLLS